VANGIGWDALLEDELLDDVTVQLMLALHRCFASSSIMESAKKG
jgi:hypothetical protein